MTPLHLRIALHYFVRGDVPYAENEPRHRYSPAAIAYTEQLREAGLLKRCDGPAEYKGTAALTAYVDALCKTRLPVLRWVIPDGDDHDP